MFIGTMAAVDVHRVVNKLTRTAKGHSQIGISAIVDPLPQCLCDINDPKLCPASRLCQMTSCHMDS